MIDDNEVHSKNNDDPNVVIDDGISMDFNFNMEEKQWSPISSTEEGMFNYVKYEHFEKQDRPNRVIVDGMSMWTKERERSKQESGNSFTEDGMIIVEWSHSLKHELNNFVTCVDISNDLIGLFWNDIPLMFLIVPGSVNDEKSLSLM